MRLPRIPCLLAVACLLAALVPATASAEPQDRIINGNPNQEGIVIPWQVGLVPREGDSVTPSVFCGGTVRDETHVITAAHCLPTRGAADLAVIAGVANRTAITGANVFPVVAITSHPSYDSPDQANDIAILTLGQPLPLDDETKIRALPPVSAGSNDVGAEAMISGWGDVDPNPEGQQSPETVNYAFINILSDGGCSKYGEVYRPGNMLCAGFTTQGGQTIDTCQGDSGGPLARFKSDGDEVLTPADFDRLIGVVSFGRGCADPEYPGIYAKVANADLNARLTAANPPARTEPTAKPSITGEPKATRSVTCDPGGWSESPTFEYTWLSAKVEGEQATDVQEVGVGQNYTLKTEDVNRIVVCNVRASGPGGYRTAQSGAITVEAAPPDPGPTNPGPTNPGPTNPGPVNPGPANPGPANPGPANPGPATPSIPKDLVAPVAGITRRNCAKRVCKLTVIASDEGGDAKSLTATVARVSGCKKGRKGAKCRKPKKLKVSSKGSGVFEIKTGKLKRARYRFTVVAVDGAGNRSAAERVTLKVK